MTTVGRDAFLAAIIANPDDAVPALIFGDWLQERGLWAWDEILRLVVAHPDVDALRILAADWCEKNGQAGRGAFIRLQCAIALQESVVERVAAGHPGDDITAREEDKLDTLRRRERELLEAHIGAWTDGLPEAIVTRECPSCVDRPADWETGVVECRRCECTGRIPDNDHFTFTRGFISEITLSWQDWQAHAAALLAACPIANAKDGLVRLTTMFGLDFRGGSEAIRAGDAPTRIVRIRGLERWHDFPEGNGPEERYLALLAAEWAGVFFDLSAARPAAGPRIETGGWVS